MTVAQIEQEIYETYQHFHREAPGVQPQEEGRLGFLWEAFDYLVTQEQ